MTPHQLEQAAKRAAEGVAAEARYQAGQRFMRIYWRALAGAVVLGATWWAWP